VSDSDGRFAFEGVSNDPSTPYLVGAEYGGVAYSGSRVIFAAGELEHEVEIRVAEVMAETRHLKISRATLRLDWSGAQLDVSESLSIHNDSSQTFYVRAGDRGTKHTSLRAGLPAAAEGFRMPHGIEPEGIERRAGEIFLWGPFYPGDQEIRFSYALPVGGEQVEIDKPFPSGVERVEILVPEGGPNPVGEGLTETTPRVVEGRSYRSFETSALAPGESLALALSLPDARVSPESLQLAEARFLLSLDDAALEVRETHVLEVSGEPGVMAGPGASLLEIQLPPASQNLRYASTASSVTLAQLPDGGLAVGGIAPPGESALEIRYRIPIVGSSVDLVRFFAKRVPLVSIFIADTGRLIPESERLHRRRPVRTEDGTYIHLEAFSVDAGEQVALRITSRPPSPGSSDGVVLAFILLAGVLSGALLITPLRGAEVTLEAAHAEEPANVRERESIYAAIHDLEHDHETGKITEADYASMRDELRARAVALLREEQREPAKVVQPPIAASPRCPSCKMEVEPSDRFCSGCGSSLAKDAASEEQG
jgi:hypothetical protein